MKNRAVRIIVAAAMLWAAAEFLPVPTHTQTPGYSAEGGYSAETMLMDMVVDQYDRNDSSGLDISKALNRSNGKYVNLYVENCGDTAVIATINGQAERVFAPEEKGHIYVEVKQGFFNRSEDYQFQVTAEDGGTVKIYYAIAQRDYE